MVNNDYLFIKKEKDVTVTDLAAPQYYFRGDIYFFTPEIYITSKNTYVIN